MDGVSQGAVGSYTFNPVTANHTITAAFVISTYTLTIATTGTGSGVVTPGVGAYTYPYGTVVTVTASANPPSLFSGRSGDFSGLGACTLTMTTDRTVIANFDQPASICRWR